MNNQSSEKNAFDIVVELAVTIGSAYSFWKKNENEIKGIFKPFFEHCAKLKKSLS